MEFLEPVLIAAFSAFRDVPEKLRALIYCVARLGDDKLAQDLVDFNVAARGVRADEVEVSSDQSPIEGLTRKTRQK